MRGFDYVWAWVKGTGAMLPLLSRIAILSGRRARRRFPLILDGRTGRRVPLILARRTGRWLILVRRWTSGRRIMGRRRSGGGLVPWIRRGKVWERGRIGVWGRELARKTSWVWEPVESKQLINSRALQNRTSLPRTRPEEVGLVAGGTMVNIRSGRGAACHGS